MNDTRATIEEFYARIGAGDAEGATALFAESVDWYVYGSPAVPWVGRLSTRAEVAEFFALLPERLERRAFDVARLLVDGEHAVALGHMHQIVRATGKPFITPFAFHFTVVDGRITRYHAYEDSHALAEAVS
ncbi:nuclear transport factor 2 family protein [Saccharopolyspora taberi]|uniref:SnoaL-like domain-containing protein n=1 Tax=Saccharopolyspora taberi TaxID=60895 RepID=A0ABN3VLQ0_9PSEU